MGQVYTAPATVSATQVVTVTAISANLSIAPAVLILTIEPLASISSVNPQAIESGVSTPVNILGTGFLPGSSVLVEPQLNGSPPSIAKVQILNDTTISMSVEVPAGESGGIGFRVQGPLPSSPPSLSVVLQVRSPAIDFGAANVCAKGQTAPAPCSRSFAIALTVPAHTTIGKINVLTTGFTNLDFQEQADNLHANECKEQTYTDEEMCSVSVEFSPLAPGLRMGAVQLLDSSNHIVAGSLLYGIGQAPSIAFQGTHNGILAGGDPYFAGVAVDAAGNLFATDTEGGLVLKAPAGCMDNSCFAVAARGLGKPSGVAVDGAGDLFVVDQFSSRVVEITPSGTQATVFIEGLALAGGVALDGAGDIFVTDEAHDRVVEIPANGEPQTTVGNGLRLPSGVAVDSAGNIFISDTGNDRVVKVPVDGGAQTTVASRLSSPQGVAIDAAGDIFVGGSGSAVEIPAGCVAEACQSVLPGDLTNVRAIALNGAGDIFIAHRFETGLVEVRRSQAPSLSFASTPVGNVSGGNQQLVTIQNIGNQPLDAIKPGLIVAGPNFALSEGTGALANCTSGFALNPGATCDLRVSFKPQSVGPLESVAVLTDNALNSQGYW